MCAKARAFTYASGPVEVGLLLSLTLMQPPTSQIRWNRRFCHGDYIIIGKVGHSMIKQTDNAIAARPHRTLGAQGACLRARQGKEALRMRNADKDKRKLLESCAARFVLSLLKLKLRPLLRTTRLKKA